MGISSVTEQLKLLQQKLCKAEADNAALTNRFREAQEAQKSSDLTTMEAQRQLSIANKKLSAHKKSSDTETQQQTKTLAEARARIKTLEKEQKEKDTAHKHQLADLRGELLVSEEDLKKF